MADTTEACLANSTVDDFTTVPILDFDQAQCPTSRAAFVASLRQALIDFGLFYLKNPPVPKNVWDDFIDKSIALCNLPLEKKLKIDMVNSKHFLGYCRARQEKTAGQRDNREIFDFLPEMLAPTPDMPVYLNVQGPSQWPEEEDLPGFRHAAETYLSSVGGLGRAMLRLLAEAFDVDPPDLEKFFPKDPPRNKLSVVRYCLPDEVPGLAEAQGGRKDGSFQGIAPHKDAAFLTYLLQMTNHPGLEVQSKSGAWIPVPPIPRTLVVNGGRALECLTAGVCGAATHRVNLKLESFYDNQGCPLGPRYSSPVFQSMRPTVTMTELSSFQLPQHIKDLAVDETAKADADAYSTKVYRDCIGKANFILRLTSHPEVGRRWYPELTSNILEEQKNVIL